MLVHHIEMLNMRYRGMITLKIDSSMDRNDEYVLSLSLQLLVENAVKHNAPQETNPLCIELYTQDGMLVVENNRIRAGRYADAQRVGSPVIPILALLSGLRFPMESSL